jgi:membrane protein implicated in regulation of membrane protease activity
MKYKYLFAFEVFKILLGIFNLIYLVDKFPNISFLISIFSIITSIAVAAVLVAVAVAVLVAVAVAVAAVAAGAVAVAVAVAAVAAGAVAAVLVAVAVAVLVAVAVAGENEEEKYEKPKELTTDEKLNKILKILEKRNRKNGR